MSVAGLGCLSEATASPCPRCGGELAESRISKEPDPFLVCRACGWSRRQSVVEHAEPYRWAIERFRDALGPEIVDSDVRPGGEGVVVRVNAPGKGPEIVELKSLVYDINRLSDPEQALAEKLARVREYLDS